jgi:hypothetical protein
VYSKLVMIGNSGARGVAHQTGTSLQMIEKAYFRFIPTAMNKKLLAMRQGRLNDA